MVEGLREQRRMVGVAAGELGAREKHNVPACGHGAKTQTPWREGAEQCGAAQRSTSVGWGPGTHEHGGAGGAPRRCARLRPSGRLGERGCDPQGSPVECRKKWFTIPLHKASHSVADTSNAVPFVTPCVASWKIVTARSTAGRSWQ